MKQLLYVDLFCGAGGTSTGVNSARLNGQSGDFDIPVYETDTPIMLKIKEFMIIYRIIDIKMRMLKTSELKLIMGFPADYILIGTQADQKKFIGNAVEVTIARKWCEALCASIKLLTAKTA